MARLIYGAWDTLRDTDVTWRVWAAEIAAALGCGAASGYIGDTVGGGYPEARLLVAATAFFSAVTVVCVVIDRVGHGTQLRRSRSDPDAALAQTPFT